MDDKIKFAKFASQKERANKGSKKKPRRARTMICNFVWNSTYAINYIQFVRTFSLSVRRTGSKNDRERKRARKLISFPHILTSTVLFACSLLYSVCLYAAAFLALLNSFTAFTGTHIINFSGDEKAVVKIGTADTV